MNWFDWALIKKHAGLHRFVQKLIALRLNFESSQEDLGLTLSEFLQRVKITWHGVKLQQPDWGEDSHTLAFTLRSLSGRKPPSIAKLSIPCKPVRWCCWPDWWIMRIWRYNEQSLRRSNQSSMTPPHIAICIHAQKNEGPPDQIRAIIPTQPKEKIC